MSSTVPPRDSGAPAGLPTSPRKLPDPPLPGARSAIEPDWTEVRQELDRQQSGGDSGPSPPVPRLLLALSGGADSVLLLDRLRSTFDPESILAVHVNHGLRGASSDGDEAFCQDLCRAWGVEFRGVRVQVDPQGGDLERRARDARYAALGRVAREVGLSLVLTAHHQDDAIETLLMRWTRGVSAAALVGMRRSAPFPDAAANVSLVTAAPPLRVLRPLLGISAVAIREDLRRRGMAWCEDATNRSPRFTRNRIRHGLLPLLQVTCGSSVLEDLRRFHGQLGQLETLLERASGQFPWEARPGTSRASWRAAREPLTHWPAELLRRSLYRSLLELTGRALRDGVARELSEALAAGTRGHWNLRGGWGLGLEARFLRLKAPPR